MRPWQKPHWNTMTEKTKSTKRPKSTEQNQFDCIKRAKMNTNWWFWMQILKIVVPTSLINFLSWVPTWQKFVHWDNSSKRHANGHFNESTHCKQMSRKQKGQHKTDGFWKNFEDLNLLFVQNQFLLYYSKFCGFIHTAHENFRSRAAREPSFEILIFLF